MQESVYIIGPQYSSFVRSVALCCEEKGINYTIGFEPYGESMEFSGVEHRNLHPFSKVPTLLHGKRSVFESASICRYLDSEFSGTKLQPEDNYGKAIVDQWSSAISGYIYDSLVKGYLLEFRKIHAGKGEVRAGAYFAFFFSNTYPR